MTRVVAIVRRMATKEAAPRRARGSIDLPPSGACRVRVYAGADPLTGRRHDLIEVVPPGPTAAADAEKARSAALMAGQLRLIRRQLAIFTAVALVALLVVALSYLQMPRLLGVGQMPVTATLPETGGLAASALVTYRGQQVGKVKDVRPAPSGVSTAPP